MPDAHDTGFLSRWARRKALARQGEPVDDAPQPPAPEANIGRASLPPNPPEAATPDASAALADPPAPVPGTEPPAPPPPPTLADAQRLTPASDFRRFVASDVLPDVRNTALKKLWADPAYNIMDGLDIYIDDYGKPDPLPPSMLRKMAQARFMNLFDDEPAPTQPGPDPAPGSAPVAEPDTATATETTASDEDPDLRLQPHDAPGPEGAEPGAEPDPGRER